MRARLPLRFRKDEGGNVAIISAIVGMLLVGMVFGVIDLGRASTAKQKLQESLDAATLFAARSTAADNTGLQTIGSNALSANMANMPGVTLVSATFSPNSDGSVVSGVATANVPTTILGLLGKSALPIGATSEVVRSSKNVEVALVLDTTGSMAGQKIIDLRAAANELVGIVVKDSQTPFYSKVAVVPYSLAVNAGSYADAIRGPVTASKTMTGASGSGNNNITITAANHGFVTGNKVYIDSVNGMTQLNGKTYTITQINSGSFKLNGTQANNFSSYTSGGKLYCVTAGCKFYNFTNPSGESNTFQISTCVTERTGSQAYTEQAPSTTYMGRNYPSPSNGCTTSVFSPLTSDKTALGASINALSAGGSTGGHIGVGWGWYMVSPNFGYLWPTATNRPAAYTKPDLLKVVVIMTDGEYNSAYCNGVISEDSTSGSGSADDHIDCNATNGATFTQALALCTSMKAAGVIVYTVGFNVVNDQRARDLVNGCATDAAHVYLPSGGTALKDAFGAIARDISGLRLSR